jgi:large conductance mechanosensitive channel
MLAEFKEFIAKGNVDFSDNYMVLSSDVDVTRMSLEAAREAGANVLAWGRS